MHPIRQMSFCTGVLCVHCLFPFVEQIVDRRSSNLFDIRITSITFLLIGHFLHFYSSFFGAGDGGDGGGGIFDVKMYSRIRFEMRNESRNCICSGKWILGTFRINYTRLMRSYTFLVWCVRSLSLSLVRGQRFFCNATLFTQFNFITI